ncbi:polysaccharide deacetylase family protein [Paenibacillus eucommiae]|uniref:Sporulation protein (Polysaccharide deacetylase family) n=1 Tax=Paenibacillus eucommiae TaxID=1355755 RepID=A0ABS4IWP7_9BACL|nr:polysaccharide deacetylase family protein [Paenibacillus eucommiae]MBP1991286.1 putative sporulation protein (polysaccharide deacetylase family) [Paenibacillus eucommiae]
MLRTKLLLSLGAFIIMWVVIQQNRSIELFVAAVQGDAVLYEGTTSLSNVLPIFARKESEDERQGLVELIQQEAAKRKVMPVDARMDRVWKAIPGYNGLEVDLEQTLRLAAHKPKSAHITYVMKETSPAIQLEDLGPSPIYKGNPLKPMVSLMINVAWGNEFIPSMLETLQNEHVHATFFFDGSWLKQNIETAKLIQDQGHELSNHAYSHKMMSKLSRSKAIEEISKTQELLNKELQVTNTLFAPPSGDFDQETVEIAADLGLRTVLWTLDTVDWTNPGAGRVLDRISSRVEPGSLILMHPTVSSSGALKGMIQAIKRKGLALGTVSELLSPNRVAQRGIDVELGEHF